jgi:hypothetical protein
MFMIEVETSGPLFDGDPDKILDDFVADAVLHVAQQGLAEWHTLLDSSLQHPTGHYESQLMVDVLAPDIAVVDDDQMIYGPWLEGTGSRNATTQFKGYAAARRAAQALEARVPQVLAPDVARLIRRLEG